MVKIFDNLFSIFSGGKKSNSVLGIDIGTSSIKVVQIKNKSGKAVLQTYGEISLGPYAQKQIGQTTKLPPEKISEALLDLLSESNVSINKSSISIPMRSSMVSIFKMPRLKEKQFQQMIPIEARKYIPVPISEVSLDWFIIPESETDNGETKNNFVEAMVVAIHNDVLSAYNQIVKRSKLDTSFFEIEMFSTTRAILDTNYNLPVMVIDIGSGATKIYIIENGVVRDSHIISRGSQEITINVSAALGINFDYAEKLKRNYGKNSDSHDQAIREAIESVIGPILSDAHSIILNFQKNHKKSVSRVTFVGGGSLLNGIKEMSQKKLGVEVVAGDPFSKVEVPAFLMDVLKETGLSFTVAIGIALRKLQELE